MMATDEDRGAIAELEEFGLSLVAINSIEEEMGLIYIDQLQGVTAERLQRCCPMMGNARIEQLRRALRKWLEAKHGQRPD